MKIWISKNSFCVLFEMWPGYYSVINFGAMPFPRINKRRRITDEWVMLRAYCCYPSFPNDFKNDVRIESVKYTHELFKLLFE